MVVKDTMELHIKLLNLTFLGNNKFTEKPQGFLTVMLPHTT